MLNLKRRWQNLSSGSRILVLIAIISVVAFASLIIFLQNQGELNPSLPGEAKTTNPTTPPTPVNFNYAVGPDATPAPPPKNEPERLLVLANRFLADGEVVDATAQYRLIISSYPKSPEVVAATFGLAQSSAARQRWQEATQL